MATSSPTTQPSAASTAQLLFERHLKPFLTPYYLVVAVALGAITAIFGALTLALILIVANFNILSLIE